MIHTLNMVWNPSEGIDLGFFLLRFYSLSWVLAFGLGWYVMKPIFMRENESVDSLDKLFLYTLVATMLGARLGHVLFYQSELFYQAPYHQQGRPQNDSCTKKPASDTHLPDKI